MLRIQFSHFKLNVQEGEATNSAAQELKLYEQEDANGQSEDYLTSASAANSIIEIINEIMIRFVSHSFTLKRAFVLIPILVGWCQKGIDTSKVNYITYCSPYC